MKYICWAATTFALLLSLVTPALAYDEAITVYNPSGRVIYSEDAETAVSSETAADRSQFLYKPFEQYSVTEGFCLLFLLLGFCWVIWKIVKGALF